MEPLDFKLLTRNAIRLSQISSNHWLEGRVSEQGRSVLVKNDLSEPLPKTANVKSRVYAYGGASYLETDHLFYIDDTTKTLSMDGLPLTKPADGNFADLNFDKKRNCLYAVREIDDKASIARIELDGTVTDILTGADFYAAPRLAPDGKHLAYISWNQPNMPWDKTTLHLFDFKTDTVIGENAAYQHPLWHPDGTLYYLSDQTGYWNLYTQNGPVCPIEGDLGYPPWVLNLQRFCFIDGAIAAILTQEGTDSLILIENGSYQTLDLPFTSYTDIATDGTNLLAIAASPTTVSSVISINPKTASYTTLRKSKDVHLDTISTPISINCGTALHFYPPSNPLYEKPPLILRCHGGPTAHSAPILNFEVQYWTSRGYAYTEVNYRGSSGFGKKYRDALNGNWGIYDVEDAVAAAEYLIKNDLVHPDKCAIMGSSAGGFTALCAATFKDTFACAISLYGISDLETLTKTTHKFEAHYNDHLIGAYPEHKQRYIDRSPIHHIDKITCPILLLQGDCDQIVPQEQSERLYNALKPNAEYHLFKGEGHGFRQAETIEASFQAQEAFLKRIFKIS